MLNQLQELLYREASLLEDVRERTLSDLGVHGYNSAPRLVSDLSFQRNVASFLAQLHEPCSLERANHAVSGNDWKFGRHARPLPRHFDEGPKRLGGLFSGFGLAPGFEVELDRFAQVIARRFDVGALRRDVEFRTASHVQVIFLGDERGKAIRHNEMVSKPGRTGKLDDGVRSTKGEKWQTN
jgi:hypothetical protein